MPESCCFMHCSAPGPSVDPLEFGLPRTLKVRSKEHYLSLSLFTHDLMGKADMKRLQLSLAFLLISTLAYAQNEPVAPAPPSAAGTEGDGWLWLLVIAFAAVAIGVYLFIKRGRATTRH